MSPMFRRGGTALAAAATLLLGMPFAAPPVQAQSREVVTMGTGTRLVSLPRGTSMAVDLPNDARDVIVSNPTVAEAVLHTPRRITIIGLAPGETDAVFLDSAGRSILTLRIRVDAGVSALQDTLSRILPGTDVRAEAVNDRILLTGTVSSPGEADRVTQIASAFVDSPEKIINMMTITGSDQVMVRARVIEVQRSAVKQLGFDVTTILDTVGDGLQLTSSATFAVAGSQLGGGNLTYTDANNDGEGLTGTLRAFERAGLVRVLAEPNATSVSGENAEFLAGGEFPVPVGRDDRGNILIEFKPYGVRLAFRPIVLSGGRISLQLSTEVSELSTSGAFTLGGTADNASSTVELPSGGSLMIAGLLREDTRQNIDQLPLLGDIPVAGGLFRSRDYLSNETELVIILEAYIVSPNSPNQLQTPADGLTVAGDASALLFGQLTQAYGPPRQTGGEAPARWVGPVGYVSE